ncbi:MAG: ribonuclease P protein component [Bacteroidetes bacterium]|nr:ribonuclease P protein component [Bacteroidota bacterium]
MSADLNRVSHKFSKNERLCSRKIFDLLINSGEQFFTHPFKVIYCYHALSYIQEPLQVAFVVPKRIFKKAHDRNRIKRLMREAFRIQKNELKQAMFNQPKKLAVLIIFVNKTLTPYHEVESKIKLILHRLKMVHAQGN